MEDISNGTKITEERTPKILEELPPSGKAKQKRGQSSAVPKNLTSTSNFIQAKNNNENVSIEKIYRKSI